MRGLLRRFTQLSINGNANAGLLHNLRPLLTFQKPFSSQDGGGNKDADWTRLFGGTGTDPTGWGVDGASSWSTGLTKEQFDGQSVGKKLASDQSGTRSGGGGGGGGGHHNTSRVDEELKRMTEMDYARRWGLEFVDSWDANMNDTATLLKQVRDPGLRGSYLKNSEKAEMYKKHKQNPTVYTVERLAKEYRIMRQRVHAILWLKELEEEEEKKHGPLDDSIEVLLDTCPEFFNPHDREFHVATLPHKPNFKVMPESWDGITRDPDEIHYEISMKEDEMLYQEFLQRFNFTKLEHEKKVKVHRYTRRRPSQGWDFTVEKLGPQGKRGGGGGWKFVSSGDGSTRPLNDIEKVFVKRETPRRRRKILASERRKILPSERRVIRASERGMK